MWGCKPHASAVRYANAKGKNASYLDRNGRVVYPKGSTGYDRKKAADKRAKDAAKAHRKSLRKQAWASALAEASAK